MKFLRTYFLPIMIAFATIGKRNEERGGRDIEHTAIIVATGVEKTEEENEVYTKIAIQQSNTQT